MVRGVNSVLVFALSVLLVAGSAAAEVCSPLDLKKTPAATENRKVAIWWDRSGSLGRSFDPVVSFLVNRLDSVILQQARATAPFRHYSVGAQLTTMTDARPALVRNEPNSAPHEAFLKAGEDLAGGAIGLAIVVTDLEVNFAELPAGTETVCHDIPKPSQGLGAAPLIGRCFEAGWRKGAEVRVKGRPVVKLIQDLNVTMFRSQLEVQVDQNNKRHLYVVLIGTDLDLTQRVVKQFNALNGQFGFPSFEEWTLIDTRARPDAVAGWTAGGDIKPAQGQQGRCSFACFDEDAILHMHLRPSVEPLKGLVKLNLPDAAGVSVKSGKVAAQRGTGQSLLVSWDLKCGEPLSATVKYPVRLVYRWSNEFDPITAKQTLKLDHAEMGQVIQSLIDGIHPLLLPRTVELSIGLK